jgi:hypothetical protein
VNRLCLEIRPFWEPEDCDPEMVAQMNALREKTAKGGSEPPPRRVGTSKLWHLSE